MINFINQVNCTTEKINCTLTHTLLTHGFWGFHHCFRTENCEHEHHFSTCHWLQHATTFLIPNFINQRLHLLENDRYVYRHQPSAATEKICKLVSELCQYQFEETRQSALHSAASTTGVIAKMLSLTGNELLALLWSTCSSSPPQRLALSASQAYGGHSAVQVSWSRPQHVNQHWPLQVWLLKCFHWRAMSCLRCSDQHVHLLPHSVWHCQQVKCMEVTVWSK